MSSSTSKASSSGRGGKTKQTSNIVVLKVSSSHLSKFPHESPVVQEVSRKMTSSSPTPTPPTKDSPQEEEAKTEIKTEGLTNGIGNHLNVPGESRRGRGGGRGGIKRGAAALGPDGLPKPRGKPGPKKRKLDGMPAADENGRPWTTPAPLAGHKLGPKANQGAINAGLRALDRNGKPCRKWTKKGFQIKSFTGITWELPSWGAPKKINEDGASATPTSNSEGQQQQGSSNIGSETSRNNVPEAGDIREASSVAPESAAPEAAASPAVIAATA